MFYLTVILSVKYLALTLNVVYYLNLRESYAIDTYTFTGLGRIKPVAEFRNATLCHYAQRDIK